MCQIEGGSDSKQAFAFFFHFFALTPYCNISIFGSAGGVYVDFCCHSTWALLCWPSHLSRPPDRKALVFVPPLSILCAKPTRLLSTNDPYAGTAKELRQILRQCKESPVQCLLQCRWYWPTLHSSLRKRFDQLVGLRLESTLHLLKSIPGWRKDLMNWLWWGIRRCQECRLAWQSRRKRLVLPFWEWQWSCLRLGTWPCQ